MELMTFHEFNLYIKSSPQFMHYIAGAIILLTHSRMLLAFAMVHKLMNLKIRIWVFFCILLSTFLFLNKYSSPEDGYKMLDVFFPLYIVNYFNIILLMKVRLFRCNMKLGDIQRFNSVKNIKK